MRVVFFSNFMNLHQLPLCQALSRTPGVDFTFIATTRIPQERIKMNYEDLNDKYKFILRTYDSIESQKAALEHARSADVAIFGSAPLIYFEERMRLNKLTFRFCERSLKKGTWRRFIPTTYRKIHREYIKYKRANLYVLSASAFTSYDLSLCGFNALKCFKWGYFPPTIEYDINSLIAGKSYDAPITILWVARMIPLKHPEVPIRLAKKLKKEGYHFNMKIIGDGPLMEKIRRMVYRWKLNDVVTLEGALPSTLVRSFMEKSDILLFTSNRREGWGAVVNEGMNSACVVIANQKIGSVPYLIEDGKTGFAYKYNDFRSLYSKVIFLYENRNRMEEMGRLAYDRIHSIWNAEIAASRFVCLAKGLLEGHSTVNLFETGPCSPASICKPGRCK